LVDVRKERWNKQAGTQVGREERELFEKVILPHLNSAYNLARWLTRNEQDAEDIVQDSFVRALRSFDTFRPTEDGRAWLLAIVRNCCRTWHQRSRVAQAVELDVDSQPALAAWSDPEALLRNAGDSEQLHAAIGELPLEYREVLILRELEELSYKEIAQIVEVPLGTVMSRLSRARRELYARLSASGGQVGR
jgi:RNA polymerase sigma-70 factor (ECF subfamily)